MCSPTLSVTEVVRMGVGHKIIPTHTIPIARRAADETNPFNLEMSMRSSTLALGLVFALVPLGFSSVQAQGFGVYEHGSCAMARAGTGVASPCGDGSSIFLNPAGLTSNQGITLTAGATFIGAFGNFTEDRTRRKNDLDNDIIPVPHVYLTYAKDRYTVGLGVFAPYGLETKWPISFEGRFAGFDNTLQSIYVQPTVAVKLTDRISIGAGLDIVLGSVELNQRLDLSEQVADPSGLTFAQAGIPVGTDFATAKLDADLQTGVGANFGVIFEATDWLSIGARYMTQVDVDYDGDATFTAVPTGLTVPADLPIAGTVVPAGTPVDAIVASQFQAGGALVKQGVKTSITMPDMFVGGVAVKATPELSLLADYQWVHWSKFDQLPVDFAIAPDRTIIENYDNTNGIRLGFDWTASERVSIRGGYLYHEAAAPPQTVTPLLPEGARNEFTLGFGFKLTDRLTATAAYQYIRQDKRRGRVREAPSGQPATTALNTGLYDFKANLVGVTFTLNIP